MKKDCSSMQSSNFMGTVKLIIQCWLIMF